ncbi:translation elongation factor P [Lichtheimia ornata]|uniref:Translation elongation factor P n=1 Tax=Lichtheimia ornata TaxID=688661 RepID=A0AAD7UVF1_9FUNG|nr:translation elongation factor P [Lichtheimia ornata]KAJ8653731.1 translation elongation factor P [Lichtheimia ornata]
MSLFARALSRTRTPHLVPINQSIAKRYYKLSVQSIKRGQVVQLKDKAWRVLNRDSSSSGRGGAVVKIEMEDLMTKAKINERFKSGDSLEILNMQEETMQYLYSEGNTIHLLNPETFDQIEMSMSACEAGEDGAAMLEDGMNLTVSFLTTPEEGRNPITFKLPQNHTYTVESVVERAGQAAKGTVYKTATLANGAKLQVPEFVHEGDRVVVDIAARKYVKRDL